MVGHDLRYMQAQTSLADAARPSEGNEAHILPEQEACSRGYLVIASNEAGALCRQLAGAKLDALERRIRKALLNGSDVPGEVAGGHIALVRRLGKTTLYNPAKRSGSLRIQRDERFGFFSKNGHQCFGTGVPLEGALSTDHLIKDGTEGELIGTEVRRLATHLFGRHITHGAQKAPGMGFEIRQ